MYISQPCTMNLAGFLANKLSLWPRWSSILFLSMLCPNQFNPTVRQSSTFPVVKQVELARQPARLRPHLHQSATDLCFRIYVAIAYSCSRGKESPVGLWLRKVETLLLLRTIAPRVPMVTCQHHQCPQYFNNPNTQNGIQQILFSKDFNGDFMYRTP